MKREKENNKLLEIEDNEQEKKEKVENEREKEGRGGRPRRGGENLKEERK